MRALASCAMAEPCTLYGMCSWADTYTTRETCMDLSMAMYLRSSLAAVDSPRMVNVSAFEHIPYSARGSAITHVASARVHLTPLACARGEHQYVSDIEVKKEHNSV